METQLTVNNHDLHRIHNRNLAESVFDIILFLVFAQFYFNSPFGSFVLVSRETILL